MDSSNWTDERVNPPLSHSYNWQDGNAGSVDFWNVLRYLIAWPFYSGKLKTVFYLVVLDYWLRHSFIRIREMWRYLWDFTLPYSILVISWVTVIGILLFEIISLRVVFFDPFPDLSDFWGELRYLTSWRFNSVILKTGFHVFVLVCLQRLFPLPFREMWRDFWDFLIYQTGNLFLFCVNNVRIFLFVIAHLFIPFPGPLLELWWVFWGVLRYPIVRLGLFEVCVPLFVIVYMLLRFFRISMTVVWWNPLFLRFELIHRVIGEPIIDDVPRNLDLADFFDEDEEDERWMAEMFGRNFPNTGRQRG